FRPTVLARVKSISHRIAFSGKENKISDVVIAQLIKRCRIRREPSVLLAGNDEFVDVTLAVHASQICRRCAAPDEMKLVLHVRGFLLLVHDAIAVDAANAHSARLLVEHELRFGKSPSERGEWLRLA